MTARAAAALSPARGPGSLRLLGCRWHRPRGSGRASGRGSSLAERQPRPASAASRSSALSLQNGAPFRRCEGLFLPPLFSPPPPSPPPLARVPLRRSPPFPLSLLPLLPPPPPSHHHHNNHLRTRRHPDPGPKTLGPGEEERERSKEKGRLGEHCKAKHQKLSTLDSLLLLHGQSPSQPSYRQTVSSKYAGRRLPRCARESGGAPVPQFPPGSSRPRRRRSPRGAGGVSAPLCSHLPRATPALPSRAAAQRRLPSERVPRALGRAGLPLPRGVGGSAGAVPSGVCPSAAAPANPGARRSAGATRRALPAGRPGGKLFGEILKIGVDEGYSCKSQLKCLKKKTL